MRKLRPSIGKQLLSQDGNLYPGEGHIKSCPKVGYVIRSREDKLLGLNFVLSSKNWEDILKFSVTACCKDGAGAADLALGKASRTSLV